MLSKKDKEQFKIFGIALAILSLILFIAGFMYKAHIFTVVGWIALLSSWYIKFWYIPKNSKKKNSTTVTSKFSISEYWKKFVAWLHA